MAVPREGGRELAPALLCLRVSWLAHGWLKGVEMTDWSNPVTFPINVANLALGVATVGLCAVYAWAVLSEWVSRLRRR